MSDTQSASILAHLRGGNSITPIEALNKFGCFRLGARIYDLKCAGHNIITVPVTTAAGKRIACYRLIAAKAA